MADTKATPFLDVDAFIRRPAGSIKVRGRTHNVFHPIDLTYSDYLKLVAAVDNPPESWWRRRFPRLALVVDGATGRLRRRSLEEQQEYRSVRKLAREITKLVPSLTERDVLRLPMREIGAIFAWIQKLMAEDRTESFPAKPRE